MCKIKKKTTGNRIIGSELKPQTSDGDKAYFGRKKIEI